MKIGMKVVYCAVWLVLAMTPLGSCYCPHEWMHGLGNCTYRIRCRHDLRDLSGLRLPRHACHVASGAPVNVTLTLEYPEPYYDNATNIDRALLASVTSFSVVGPWPQHHLSIVERMYALTDLHLVGNQIQLIEGRPFYQLVQLETVDLSHNQLTRIDELLQIEMQPNKLWRLSLAYNAIEYIPDDAFDQVTSLIELDLSNNSISTINNMTFSNLTRLEVLKLSNNRIYDLDGALNTLKVLKHLYLGGNQIQNVDIQSIKVIHDLETFDVSSNRLENLFPAWLSRHWHHFGSRSTCKIMLSGNYITYMPNATSRAKMARYSRNAESNNFIDVQTELDLSNNVITTIEPYALQYIAHLSLLDLSRNKLITFVINAEDLKHVKYLNLSNNLLDHLDYESFSAMDNLQNLDLSFNKLDNLAGQSFTSSLMLRYVNVSHNYMEKIKNFRLKMFHPEGGVLDLSENSISSVNIPHGEGLNFLILRSNRISNASLVELRNQKDLKYLDLSYNEIEILTNTSFRLPSSLLRLDLTRNNITYLGPSTFKGLGQLQTLRLQQNGLNTLEYGAFNSLTALSELDLSGNDIQILDSKVLMDLKSLRVISLRSNDMHYLDYESWISHKHNLRVIVDGNGFSCTWLAKALNDYNKGYSKMELVATAAGVDAAGPSLGGIPCMQHAASLIELPSKDTSMGNTADERLLILTSKILEAIKEQNEIIKGKFHHSLASSYRSL